MAVRPRNRDETLKPTNVDLVAAQEYLAKRNKKRLSLDLSSDVILKMKKKALDEGVTLTCLFTRFAENYTNDKRD